MNIAHDLQTIVHQEQTLVFPQFDSDRAWQIGSQLREMAVARGAVVAIEVRTFGQPLFFAALDGTTPDNVRWVQRKARTVEHFRRSSYAIGLSLQQASRNPRRQIQSPRRRVRLAWRRVPADRKRRGCDRRGDGVGLAATPGP